MGRTTVGLIMALWVIPISFIVNWVVPNPYMDEIFHIPQAQQYCKGNFKSWDPMITTPPGLYYLSLAHVASLFPGMHLMGRISSFSDLCSAPILRSVNGVLAVICGILVYEIITHLRPGIDSKKATVYSIVLSLYPLHWFFTYLYYTDVASLMVFLAMYLTSLKEKYSFSALLGALAISIRQTNVIWMLFVACSSVIDMTLVHQRDSEGSLKFDVTVGENGQIARKGEFEVNPGLRKRKMKSNVYSSASALPRKTAISTSHVSGLLNETHFILIQSWHMKLKILASFSPFILVLGVFVAFVFWNGSVVLGMASISVFSLSCLSNFHFGLCMLPHQLHFRVFLVLFVSFIICIAGAKDAHAVSPHLSQILYFALVSALFSAPFHFTLGRAVLLLRSFWKSRPLGYALGFVACAAGLLSVHFFSIAHPYLLADNRHYPFYIWRKVINAHFLMKYLLLPLYIYSWLSILDILVKVRSRIWVLAYFLACAAALAPAPLIEFRYYIIPFFIFILNCGIEVTIKWLLLGALYTVINGFTMYMFLFRPFKWDHEPGTQRFIW